MHTFVVVAAKPGRAVPPPLVDLLRRDAPPECPFVPAHHVAWSDDAGATWFAGWQAPDQLGIGRRWEVRPAGVTAYGGFLWHGGRPWSNDRSWAAQIADLFAETPLHELAPRLDGVFAAFSIDHRGVGCVAADPLGMTHLYRGETDEVVVVSNRSAVAARLLAGPHREPARDPEGAAWLIYHGTMQQGRTGYQGVHLVPAGATLVRTPDRPFEVDRWSRTPWWGVDPIPAGDRAEAIASIGRTIQTAISTHAAMPGARRTFELTGGHDSRLVLAMALEAGVEQRFSYATWGEPSLSDVEVARHLAEMLDLEHTSAGATRRRRNGPGPTTSAVPGQVPDPGSGSTPTFEAALRHHVWATSGGRSFTDQIRPGLWPTSDVAICGVFGELLRSVHPGARALRDERDLAAYVVSGELHGDAAGLLRPEVRDRLDRQVIAQVSALHDGSRPVEDAFGAYYLTTRLREWFGTGNPFDHRNRLYPLYALDTVRTAFALGAEVRRSELIGFELTRSAGAGLASAPFAAEGWPRAAVAGRPDAHLYPTFTPDPAWSPRWGPIRARWRRDVRPRAVAVARQVLHRPRPAPPPPTNVVDLRHSTGLDEKLPVMQQLLDLGADHPLFDLVDRSAAHRAVAGLAVAGHHERRAVYNMVTAAVWLGGNEARFDDRST